ncbi:hypothetical protein MM300_06605 [Evansella sp. LMS18]|nr:hypothetical protein [Evansella sp. LMS18]UTR11959.1 hypothetical protein MM300_06605 [Evansella sp. LMS18]
MISILLLNQQNVLFYQLILTGDDKFIEIRGTLFSKVTPILLTKPELN